MLNCLGLLHILKLANKVVLIVDVKLTIWVMYLFEL
jgi:hypothetical protein